MAFKTFANGFPLPASDLNNFLMKQSVIVFADEAARTAALSEPTEGMVTYLESDNELYKWTGASWVNVAPTPDLSALIPKSTVTTAGDLIVADGASSVTRLGIGADGTVLTSDGTTATWEASGGGSLTLLSTTTLTGTSVSVTSIDQSYKNLLVRVINAQVSANLTPLFLLNGLSNRFVTKYVNTGTTVLAGNSFAWEDWEAAHQCEVELSIFNYSASHRQSASFFGNYFRLGAGTPFTIFAAGHHTLTNPIASITFEAPGGTWTAGTVEIYGVN